MARTHELASASPPRERETRLPWLIKGYIINRLLNEYRKIFGTRSSSPYELVPNILRYSFNNL